jgi:hypothetical protein
MNPLSTLVASFKGRLGILKPPAAVSRRLLVYQQTRVCVIITNEGKRHVYGSDEGESATSLGSLQGPFD